MLCQVHTGHLGVTKTLERAKDNIFWPGMSKQITDHVLNCSVCLKHRDSNAKEPLIAHEFPQRPYQKIGTDIFTFDGKNYLLTTCYFSRFFEIDLLPNMRAETVIQKLKVHMSRNGIVDVCISDNGSVYTSQAFADFAKEWGFTHKTSSPLHPISNGLSEKTVSIAKRILKKASCSKTDPYLLILEYRNTPLEYGYSPSQLLMGRRTKSVVPITKKLLQPKSVDQNEVQKRMLHSKTVQKKHYDRSAKPLPPLKVNDSVRVQFGKIWKPAKVIKKHDSRSYVVQTNDGAIYRRNRRLLIKTKDDSSNIQSFQPNILATPQSSNFPDEPPPINNTDRNKTSPYVTRFGREVKPVQRYDRENWV